MLNHPKQTTKTTYRVGTVMARIKRVFSNASECIHIWANRIQDEGRSSNVSFKPSKYGSEIGDVLYSYSTAIAAFRETDLPIGEDGKKPCVVFLNNYSYSHTTSGHQSDVRSAVIQPVFDYDNIPKWVSQDVPYICGRRSSYLDAPDKVEPSRIWQQYHNIYIALLGTACLKKFSRTSNDRKNMAFQYATKANRIKEYFALPDDDYPALSFEVTQELQAVLDAANAKKAEKERLAFERSKQERLDWLQGISHRYPDAHTNPIVLRVHPSEPNRVQTSRGAVVPLRVCKSLYEAFKAQSMPEDTRVGNFTLQGVYDWGIRIGCHNIQAKELERFAKVIGLSA